VDRPPLSRPAVVVAILVLLGFAAFVLFLIGQVDEDEVAWTRLAWIFASVEAVAFAAAGAIFGSSIQRERAERAEEAAQENAQDAANGRALAAALKAEASVQDAGAPGTFQPTGEGAAAQSIAARHAELATRLFPEG
jgi:hypothetical protein